MSKKSVSKKALKKRIVMLENQLKFLEGMVEGLRESLKKDDIKT